ncbi:MAG: T9SS type A sorting domain-containing protein [Bacteroidetes bacterium]|nr:T9SS type A sorting domain-containing protein [Bacteroidota bacterium]
MDSVMSSTDTTSLENIVSLHWLYTGDAVYEAAGALGYEYHSPEISLRMQNSQISIQQPSDTSLLTTIPVSIHPNPTGTSTYVSVETTKAYRLELFDMFNRLVQVQHNTPVLDVSNLAGGIFILNVIIEQQVIHSGKIVVLK